MSDDTKVPKKRGRPRKKKVEAPKLAEVVQLHAPDEDLITVLEGMLELAQQGRLTALLATATIDNRDEIMFLGRPEQVANTVLNLEILKAELIDCVRSMEAEEG